MRYYQNFTWLLSLNITLYQSKKISPTSDILICPRVNHSTTPDKNPPPPIKITKGLDRQHLIGSAVAGFNHARTIANALGKPSKKTIESVNMLIPRGGGVLKPALTPP